MFRAIRRTHGTSLLGWPSAPRIPGSSADYSLSEGCRVTNTDLVFLRSGGLACLVEVEEPNKTAGTAQERAPGFTLELYRQRHTTDRDSVTQLTDRDRVT